MNRILVKFSLLLMGCTMMFMTSCDDDNPFAGPDLSTVPDPISTSGITPDTSQTGLITYVIEEGTGPLEVTIRDFIGYKYTLRLLNGRIIESSYSNGSTDPVFRNAKDHIEGFREALLGMKEGGVKVIIVPPELGYGNSPGNDLSDDTLRFDLELTNISY